MICQTDLKEEVLRLNRFQLSGAVYLPETSKNKSKLAALRAGFKVRKNIGLKGYYIEANESAEQVVDLFLGLIATLFNNCEYVDAFFDSYHQKRGKHFAVKSKEINILLSLLEDFRELLLNDGEMNIDISPEDSDIDVSLNGDKTITVNVFDTDMHTIRRVKTFLRGRGLKEDDYMKAVYEFLHFQNSSDELKAEFDRLIFLSGAFDENEKQDIELC